MTQEEFTKRYRVAHDADDNYQATVLAAGFKSRWDVPKDWPCPAIRAAKAKKIAADASMHDAWEEMRLAKSA